MDILLYHSKWSALPSAWTTLYLLLLASAKDCEALWMVIQPSTEPVRKLKKSAKLPLLRKSRILPVLLALRDCETGTKGFASPWCGISRVECMFWMRIRRVMPIFISLPCDATGPTHFWTLLYRNNISSQMAHCFSRIFDSG